MRKCIAFRAKTRSLSQFLVELATTQQATQARDFLNGKDIYQDCCKLSISYSNLKTLSVKGSLSLSSRRNKPVCLIVSRLLLFPLTFLHSTTFL